MPRRVEESVAMDGEGGRGQGWPKGRPVAAANVVPASTGRRLRLAAACCAALVFIAACTTIPQRTTSEWAGVLPPGATLYASLAVKGSADFIKRLLKESGPGAQDLNALIDRTDRMVASVTLARGEGPRYSVVALGSYPSAFIGMRLAGSREWARKSSDIGGWWEWGKVGLQMSIPNDAIMLAANGDVQSLLARWGSPRPLPVPADVAADMQAMAFVLYMPELPGGMTENAAKNGVHLPIQDVWMSASKIPGAYVISGTANTTTEKEAKLLTLVLRLGVVAWMRTQNVPNASERLKAITVSPAGTQVRLTGMRVGEDELIPLFLAMLKSMSPPEEPAGDAPAEGSTP
jgi:hypothetical protein